MKRVSIIKKYTTDKVLLLGSLSFSLCRKKKEFYHKYLDIFDEREREIVAQISAYAKKVCLKSSQPNVA